MSEEKEPYLPEGWTYGTQQHIPGLGCTCGAYGECECGCDADWRSAREVELEALVVELRKDRKIIQLLLDKISAMEANNGREI